MNTKSYNVIGVMSGTSLDGVDLAHIHFDIKNQKWSFEILECETIIYSQEWLGQLKIAVGFSKEKLEKLNSDYTILLGGIISDFIKKHKIEKLDAVCSHGHTILHQPQNGFTLQIGNLPEIAKLTNQTVICDFRVQDVELGGQGAPLVPIGDRILFSDYDYCLNLGGFSNVSFEETHNKKHFSSDEIKKWVPDDQNLNNISEENERRIAFDISPVNTVLNFYANQLGLDYDDKGQLSRKGKMDFNLFNQLNHLDFYQKKYPKSLGFEFVKDTVLPLIENHDIAIENKLHTFTEHIAKQIALALPNKSRSLFITGGGAYNDFLIERIQFHLPEMKIIIPKKGILEFKEALIFALLGVLKLRNEINVLSSVTGAKMNHSSGKIYQL